MAAGHVSENALLKKRNMNNAMVSLFMSSKGKIANSLKRGLVWSVYFENVIIRIIFFCNLLIGCNLDVYVFPHVILP